MLSRAPDNFIFLSLDVEVPWCQLECLNQRSKVILKPRKVQLFSDIFVRRSEPSFSNIPCGPYVLPLGQINMNQSIAPFKGRYVLPFQGLKTALPCGSMKRRNITNALGNCFVFIRRLNGRLQLLCGWGRNSKLDLLGQIPLMQTLGQLKQNLKK